MLTTTSHPAFQTPIDTQIDGITVDTNSLLLDLLESDRPLIAIAKIHKLTAQQLIVWCSQPAIQSLLDQLDSLALRRAAAKAAHARQGAIQVLQEQAVTLYETPRGLALANTAARALLRVKSTPDESPTPQVSKRIHAIRSELSPADSNHPEEPRRKTHPANPTRAKSTDAPLPSDDGPETRAAATTSASTRSNGQGDRSCAPAPRETVASTGPGP